MNCQECKDNRLQTADVPYFVHEGMLARMERANKRLWVILIIVIVLFVGTNAGWIYYENHFEDVVTTEIEQQTGEGSGSNYIVGGDYHGNAENQNDANP